jgi:hypothetical protein
MKNIQYDIIQLEVMTEGTALPGVPRLKGLWLSLSEFRDITEENKMSEQNVYSSKFV